MQEGRGVVLAGWPLALFGLIMGASLVAGTLIVANTIDYVKTLDSSLITVTGSTQQQITSDEVKWTMSFSREAPANDLTTGSDQMKKDLDLVLKYLTTNGVPKADVTVQPMMINPIYNNCFAAAKLGAAGGCVNTIVSYRLDQTVVVNSGDVQKITALAQNSNVLIKQGVVLSTRPLEYFYTKLPSLRVQLLAAATKDAQLRAEKIAETTGARVGRLESVSSGVFQITPVNSTQISGEGTYDTSTIQKEITAVVRASFTLAP